MAEVDSSSRYNGIRKDRLALKSRGREIAEEANKDSAFLGFKVALIQFK
jgi:hypothetical protein